MMEDMGKEVNMYKTDVIQRVTKETRLSKRVVADVIAASHRLIEETLRAGEAVTFPGFGTFYPNQRQEGKVRHIRTGRTVTVPARMVARFRAGEVLKRAVAGKRRR
jgi:DNA-binding protein HU-beta